MPKKFYDRFYNFIRKNFKLIIIYAVLICFFTIPLDYEIYTPGGLINLTERIHIDNNSKSEKGSFNLTYVGAKKGIIPMILLSYVFPNWDLVDIDDLRIDDEDYEQIAARGKIDLETVNQTAIAVAFETAQIPYKIKSYDVVVYHVFNTAKTNLKVGDIIKQVNNKSVNSLEELKIDLQNYNIDDEVKFTIIRDDEELEVNGIIYEENGEKLIGLYLQVMITVDTDIKVEFEYNANEQGSSGGLMSALEIYNNITDFDLTKGNIISGTGTINLDGTVGEIAGVKYKLAGAVRNGANVFICPAANYEEAIKEKEKNNYEIEIIKAINFKNVVKQLKER